MLNQYLEALGALAPEAQEAVVADAIEATKEMVWCPNPGPQTDAYFSEADELFYGGQAGGGKSDLLLGLAVTAHSDSLILRRVNKDVADIAERGCDVAGPNKAAYNGQSHVLRTTDDRKIEFGGCQLERDKERRKGRAKDFYGFDEISDFTLTQFKFITTWNRSSKAGQRCRVVCAGNPPTRPEGLWVIKYWAPWLDPKHAKPAKPGELRWFIRGELDEDIEVDGPGPHVVAWEKKPIKARSRTFIPAKLSDNPDLAETDYEAALDGLPAELRAAYRDGNFQAELKDDAWQLIPTEWITAAQARWKPDGYREHLMTGIGCDAAGGGEDAAEICARYGGWFSTFETVKGKETADGGSMAGRIIKRRRHKAPVILDAGGGYAGTYAMRLEDNGVSKDEIRLFKGSEATAGTTNDNSHLKFFNRRAEAYWRVREALDPEQEGGSVVALPPDDELKADLAAVHWETTRQGIKLEDKKDITERIGRSPGKGDTVAMLLSEGDKAIKRRLGSLKAGGAPVVNRGHAAIKQRRR